MGYYIDFVFDIDVSRDEVLGRLARVGAVRNTDVDERKPVDEFWYPGAAAWTGQAIQVMVYTKESRPPGNWAHTRFSRPTNEAEWDHYFEIIFRVAVDIRCRVYDGQIQDFVTPQNWKELTLRNFTKSARAIVGMVGSDDASRLGSPRLDRPVDLWSWSVRTEACLRKAGILTTDDLLLRSEQDLMAIPNLGHRGLREIRDQLAAGGLTLKGDSKG